MVNFFLAIDLREEREEKKSKKVNLMVKIE
jgi:hypothetical protein